MNLMELQIKSFLTAIISYIAYLMGGFDKSIEILLVLIVIDYVSGLMKSILKGQLDSRVGAKGILKKICIFIVVALSVQIERFVNQPESIHNIVAFFYVVNESISILENIGTFIPIPKQLRQMLNRLRDENNLSGEEKSNDEHCN